MNIKEIEERSGLPRSGIRFYESEGLLSPLRSPNGYRDYSEEDLRTLLKVKRLRALGLPVAEIRDIQSGAKPLSEALRGLLDRLGELRGGLAGAEAECRGLLAAGACWDDMMTVALPSPAEAAPGEPESPREPARSGERVRYFDTGIKYYHSSSYAPEWRQGYTDPGPWRRYFARFLDRLLYNALVAAFTALVLRVNPAVDEALDRLLTWFFSAALLLTLEPLCLHFWGTTPGKWLLGIRVLDYDGQRLSLGEAAARTFKVFVFGMGLQLPVLELVANFLAWRRCARGEDQLWDSEYGRWLPLCRPRGAVVTAAGAAACVLVPLLVISFSLAAAQMPPNRGDMSAAEFAENYNDLSDYFGGSSYEEMTESGLVDITPPNVAVVNLADGGSEPEFAFSEYGGILTREEFTACDTGAEGFVSTYVNYMEFAVMAYIWGRPGAGLLDTEEREEMLNFLSEHALQPFEATWAGVRVSCEVEYSGYEEAGAFGLLPAEGEEQHFWLHFVMEKI